MSLDKMSGLGGGERGRSEVQLGRSLRLGTGNITTCSSTRNLECCLEALSFFCSYHQLYFGTHGPHGHPGIPASRLGPDYGDSQAAAVCVCWLI